MSEPQKIMLKPEREEFIAKTVKAGHFKSANDAFDKSVALLEEKVKAYEEGREAYRAAIRAGLESGEPEYISREDSLAAIHAEYYKK